MFRQLGFTAQDILSGKDDTIQMIFNIIEYTFFKTINPHTHLVLFICLLSYILFLYRKIAYVYLKKRALLKQKNNEMLSWPVTEGVIEGSVVGEGNIPGEDGGTFTCFHLNYTYSVNNKNFHSNNFKPFVPLGDSEAVCNKLVSEYPAGKKVTVYYNPGNPEEAYLQKSNKNDIRRAGGFPAFIFISFLCFGIVGTWFGCKIPAGILLVFSFWILTYKKLPWIEKMTKEFV